MEYIAEDIAETNPTYNITKTTKYPWIILIRNIQNYMVRNHKILIKDMKEYQNKLMFLDVKTQYY